MQRAQISVLLAVTLVTGCSDDADDAVGASTSTASSAVPRTSTSSIPATAAATTPTTSGGIAAVRRAAAVCESLVAAGDPARASVLSSAPSVAGAVVAELAAGAAPPGPWGEVPADHFVAVCTLSGSVAGESPPTTTCPDGAVVLDIAVEALFADEEGRTSDASAVYDADRCTEPPPLP